MICWGDMLLVRWRRTAAQHGRTRRRLFTMPMAIVPSSFRLGSSVGFFSFFAGGGLLAKTALLLTGARLSRQGNVSWLSRARQVVLRHALNVKRRPFICEKGGKEEEEKNLSNTTQQLSKDGPNTIPSVGHSTYGGPVPEPLGPKLATGNKSRNSMSAFPNILKRKDRISSCNAYAPQPKGYRRRSRTREWWMEQQQHCRGACKRAGFCTI